MKTNLLLRVLCCLLVATMMCIGIIACKDNNGNSNNDNGNDRNDQNGMTHRFAA